MHLSQGVQSKFGLQNGNRAPPLSRTVSVVSSINSQLNQRRLILLYIPTGCSSSKLVCHNSLLIRKKSKRLHTLQVYEVNSEYNDPHFRSHMSDSQISGSHGVVSSHSSPNNKSEDVAMNQLSLKQQTKHEYDVSNYADVDPWDMIQINQERSKM